MGTQKVVKKGGEPRCNNPHSTSFKSCPTNGKSSTASHLSIGSHPNNANVCRKSTANCPSCGTATAVNWPPDRDQQHNPIALTAPPNDSVGGAVYSSNPHRWQRSLTSKPLPIACGVTASAHAELVCTCQQRSQCSQSLLQRASKRLQPFRNFSRVNLQPGSISSPFSTMLTPQTFPIFSPSLNHDLL